MPEVAKEIYESIKMRGTVMLDCNAYDYIELACMYKMSVTFTAKNGGIISGKAMTTLIDRKRKECIKLLTSAGESTVVVLSEMKTMSADQPNPHFKKITFMMQ
ncbi:MAG: Rho-binding antiterminator [Glaciecola sp.]